VSVRTHFIRQDTSDLLGPQEVQPIDTKKLVVFQDSPFTQCLWLLLDIHPQDFPFALIRLFLQQLGNLGDVDFDIIQTVRSRCTDNTTTLLLRSSTPDGKSVGDFAGDALTYSKTVIDLDVTFHDLFVLLEKLHRNSTSFGQFPANFIDIGIRPLLDDRGGLVGRAG